MWKNRKKILEGISNTIWRKPYVEKIAAKRRKICESNACGLYDHKGESEKCYLPGKPCCGGCGCSRELKIRSLSTNCYLKDVGKFPLWEAVMSDQEEQAWREKSGLKNE